MRRWFVNDIRRNRVFFRLVANVNRGQHYRRLHVTRGNCHAAPACGHPGCGCGGLQPPDGRRRDGHDHLSEVAPPGTGRFRDRRTSRPHRQDHRRRHAGGIRQRGGCGCLCGPHSAPHARAQRRYSAGQADRVPDRHQRRRHHHRRRRYLRRRRQYRRAAGNAVRTRRRVYFAGRQRPDQGQAFDRLLPISASRL